MCRHKREASTDGTARGEGNASETRPTKRAKRAGVSFRDEYGGILAEVVGISDGADVSTEPGPIGVREGSLVGKYESLVQVTVIPKGQDDSKSKSQSKSIPGVTQRLQQYLDKVKSPNKGGGGLYGDLYGDSVSGLVGGSWAGSTENVEGTSPGIIRDERMNPRSLTPGTRPAALIKDDNVDDLFGDAADDRSITAAPLVLKSSS